MGPEKPPDKKKPNEKVLSMPVPKSDEYQRQKARSRLPDMNEKAQPNSDIEPADSIFEEAIRAENLGDYKRALRFYQKVINLDEDNDKVFNNMGKIYYYTNDLAQAEKNWERALGINPKNSVVNSNMGDLKDRQGKSKEAIEYYLRAIESDPTYLNATYNLAITYQKLGQYKEAIKYYYKCLKLIKNKNSDTYWKAILDIAIEECQDSLAKSEGKPPKGNIIDFPS